VVQLEGGSQLLKASEVGEHALGLELFGEREVKAI
jgi:hypothetical protein